MELLERIAHFTHSPVTLTEVVDGDRLGRLLRFYEKGGKIDLSSNEPATKKSMHYRPGEEFARRMWPTGGSTFTKIGNTWSRSREYKMAKSEGDHRFHSQVHQLKRLERSWITPFSFSVDIANCHFSILRLLMDKLFPEDPVESLFPCICRYVSNRQSYWEELNEIYELPNVNWKPMFCSMIMNKSPQSWIKDENLEPKLPTSVTDLWNEVQRFLPIICSSSLGVTFKPNGYTKMTMHEIQSKTIYGILSAFETQQMLIFFGVTSLQNHPPTMWIHDGIDLLSNGLTEEDEIKEYLNNLRPELTKCGFSEHLKLSFKSKCRDVMIMSELIEELEDVEVPVAAESMEYDQLKEKLESDDYFSGGRSLCWIESRQKYLYLIKEREYPTAILSTEALMISHFKNLPLFEDPNHPAKFNPVSREWTPGKKIAFINRWMKDSTRVHKSTAKVVFPGNPEFGNPSIYNYFSGFDVERWPKLTEEEMKNPEIYEEVQFVWQHLRSLVDDDRHVEWWKNFLCHMFQFPDQLPRVAGVMHSMNQGAGKNLFETIFRTMLGSDYSVSINNPQEALLGTFNSSMEGKVLIVINESTVNENSCVDVFTDLITNPILQVRKMHTERYCSENHCRFWITTNASNCTPIKSNERRFQISSSNNSMLDHVYASRLASVSSNKRVMRALYEELMSRPMEPNFPFAQTRVPSALYLNMQASSVPVPVRFIIEWLNSHVIPSATSEFFIPLNQSSSSSDQFSMGLSIPDNQLKGPYLTASALYNHYTKWAGEAGLGNTGNSHSRVLESRDQFTSKLIAELQVSRESKEFSKFGAMYFKERSRKAIGADSNESGQSMREKHIWVFHLEMAKSSLSEKYPLT